MTTSCDLRERKTTAKSVTTMTEMTAISMNVITPNMATRRPRLGPARPAAAAAIAGSGRPPDIGWPGNGPRSSGPLTGCSRLASGPSSSLDTTGEQGDGPSALLGPLVSRASQLP
ncbi:hypothetical protein HPB51_017456 [Rhipicephalus microplus]|uniref:Uncharacterized protein n=1 Tax=Rhipicephalus microplus TaxID=6941 RepID=A0A9J6F4B4_RHIMP|nr:hypothetical protein HPB51_017456 [Rhipicephalus microplus]